MDTRISPKGKQQKKNPRLSTVHQSNKDNGNVDKDVQKIFDQLVNGGLVSK